MTHKPFDLATWTKIFKELGAKDPKFWAESQLEGHNQIGRFLFLKELWSDVLGKNDDKVIEAWIEDAQKQGKNVSEFGKAVLDVHKHGVESQALLKLLREFQIRHLYSICYTISGYNGALPKEIEGFDWQLVQVDADGSSVDLIEALYESVQEFDEELA